MRLCTSEVSVSNSLSSGTLQPWYILSYYLKATDSRSGIHVRRSDIRLSMRLFPGKQYIPFEVKGS